MEQINLILGDDARFDEMIHGSPNEAPMPKQASDVTICTKDAGTVKGRPIAAISFEIELPDGTRQRVQAVTTVACLATVFSGLRGRYGPGGSQAHRFQDNPFLPPFET